MLGIIFANTIVDIQGYFYYVIQQIKIIVPGLLSPGRIRIPLIAFVTFKDVTIYANTSLE